MLLCNDIFHLFDRTPRYPREPARSDFRFVLLGNFSGFEGKSKLINDFDANVPAFEVKVQRWREKRLKFSA